MGYGLMVYAVELDKVRAAVGSDDEMIRRVIGGRFKRDIARGQLVLIPDRGRLPAAV